MESVQTHIIKQMKHFRYLVFSGIFFFSCSSAYEKQAESYDTESRAEMAVSVEDNEYAEKSEEKSVAKPSSKNDEVPETKDIQQKIIKEGSIYIKVSEIAKSKSFVDSLVRKFDCYYSYENLSNSNYAETYSLKVRIPNKSFERFVAELEKGTGKITEKNINAKDVTEKFYDIETRLKSKKEFLIRYTELLKKAKTIEEMLEIQNYIRHLQEEIDSAEGRLRLLSNQISFSTLTIQLTKEKEYVYEPSEKDDYSERIKLAFSNGWKFISELFLVLIQIWPLWLIIFGVVWFIRKRRKKMKNKQ